MAFPGLNLAIPSLKKQIRRGMEETGKCRKETRKRGKETGKRGKEIPGLGFPRQDIPKRRTSGIHFFRPVKVNPRPVISPPGVATFAQLPGFTFSDPHQCREYRGKPRPTGAGRRR